MHPLRVIAAAAALLFAACGSEPQERAAAPAPRHELDVDLRKHPWPGLDNNHTKLVPAPIEVGPPSNVQAQLILPSRGRAGVFCGRYGVAAGADGRYGVYRLVEGRAPERVHGGRVEPGGRSDPGEPTVVRLVCGERRKGRPVVIGFMINASPIAFAQDDDPRGAEAPGRVGALRIGPARDARYLRFIATEEMP